MHAQASPRRVAALALGLSALLGPASHAFGQDPAALLGSPAKVTIEPGDPTLTGRRATRQLLATGTYPDGSVRDLTRVLEWSSLNPGIATISPKGQVVPHSDGSATIVAHRGSVEVRTNVKVEKFGAPAPISFRRDVIPAFSQAGCNMGACHGTPTGKGGFKLSLRGYMPDQDFVALSREAAGRRIDPLQPETSMILRKPLGELAHEGGLRLFRDTKTYEYLRDWVAEGAINDPTAPAAVKLEILPGARVLNAPATTQQVAVVARYADGSSRDVTPICYYNSSNPEIAEVDVTGHVTFKSRGEVAVIAHYLDLVANVRLTHLVAVPGFAVAEVPKDNSIDEAVFAKLNRMRIKPSEVCTDSEFVRRVYLDAVGLPPNPDEVRAFLADPSPTKRVALINRLLEKPEFLDFWTLKFADILRANGRLIQSKGTHVFNRWIRTSLAQNKPLDQFVRELITADGSSFQNPAANYYRISRDPENSVETTAQLFLGVRIQCAKCHNHVFERWTQDDYYGFAAFFARVRQKKGNLPDEEVIFAARDGEVRQPRTGQVMKPKALGGPTYEETPGANGPEDRRTKLAVWLTSAENPFFAKSLVNRIWFHLMGRGIVEPVDDFRDSNPASNDELLNGLASDFAKGGYNLKALVRSILSSRTYQLSARTNELNTEDTLYFSHAYTKLLPAEVLLDAISSLTGSSTVFEGLPKGTRATQIADGKMENPFLKTFGRPARELACECERESDANLSQALQLIGGATVNGKLHDDAGRIAELAKGTATPQEITKELYLRAVSREPNSTEMEIAVAHLKANPDRRQAIEDIGWALINSKEFLFRH
ncbi:MAG: Ig-like protein [Planctomycetota bacterium]|nr:Ig-like protein [Planctomycetota bacterium]